MKDAKYGLKYEIKKSTYKHANWKWYHKNKGFKIFIHEKGDCIYTSPCIHPKENKDAVKDIIIELLGENYSGWEINCKLAKHGIACGWFDDGKVHKYNYDDCTIWIYEYSDGIVTIDRIEFNDGSKIEPCCGNKITPDEMAAKAYKDRRNFYNYDALVG